MFVSQPWEGSPPWYTSVLYLAAIYSSECPVPKVWCLLGCGLDLIGSNVFI